MFNLHRVKRAAVVTATTAAALVTLAGTAGATTTVDEIAYGDRGAGVRCVQLALNASTVHAGLKTDGIWGARTEDAVRKFQRTYTDMHGDKLDVDGIVGHSTGRVMLEVLVHYEHDSAQGCYDVIPT
ncbi:peptidoglycan-binding protein [Streptomyces sp. UNOB3_S3]|uniref:peptidoglycan-binding domain-containing protein n=1 Tax=Streptomyces sp. UNOB3_S3 TaxID=2871682 RepID=UPI001E3DA7DC|nr:peptidoglycan-binding domain-containing protein [Streptomyces sp. UNOB3_S3]MCC3778173.1 peptidoglycan-binding protein [Streptomyces sp. UNOB3_S3]